MRELWLELVDLYSAISLCGTGSIINVNQPAAVQTRLAQLHNAISVTDLAGLGYETNTNASYVEPFGFVDTNEELVQPAVSGVLNFKATEYNGQAVSPYANYFQFVRLTELSRLRLRYNFNGDGYDHAGTYQMDGELAKLSKGEISAGRLKCPFEFRGSVPFYRYATQPSTTLAANTALAVVPTNGELSGYRNSFLIKMTMSASSSTGITATLYYTDTGETIAKLELSNSIVGNDIIVWSSDPENPMVTVNDNDPVINGWLNLANDIFPNLPASGVSFKCSKACKVSFTFKTFHRSV